MRHLGYGHWPGIFVPELSAEERRKRRLRIYRTRRPRWLKPTIAISPDPERCAFCTAQRFDLLAPDHDVTIDDPPDTPMAMSVCQYTGQCRYQVVLSPQPWHDFGPVVTCLGFEAAYSDQRRCIVDLSPGDVRWWPNQLPSEPRPSQPTLDELITYIGLDLIPRQLRELHRIDPTRARKLAHERIKKYRQYGSRFNARWGTPHVELRSDEIRIWNILADSSTPGPTVVMPIKDFIARVMPASVVQTRLI